MYPLHRVSSLLSPEQLSSSIVLSQALAECREQARQKTTDGDKSGIAEGSEEEGGGLAMDVSSQDDKQSENVSG